MPYGSKPMKLVTVWFTEEEKVFLDELLVATVLLPIAGRYRLAARTCPSRSTGGGATALARGRARSMGARLPTADLQTIATNLGHHSLRSGFHRAKNHRTKRLHSPGSLPSARLGPSSTNPSLVRFVTGMSLGVAGSSNKRLAAESGWDVPGPHARGSPGGRTDLGATRERSERGAGPDDARAGA